MNSYSGIWSDSYGRRTARHPVGNRESKPRRDKSGFFWGGHTCGQVHSYRSSRRAETSLSGEGERNAILQFSRWRDCIIRGRGCSKKPVNANVEACGNAVSRSSSPLIRGFNSLSKSHGGKRRCLKNTNRQPHRRQFSPPHKSRRQAGEELGTFQLGEPNRKKYYATTYRTRNWIC